MWYLPFTNSPRKHTVTYHFSDLQEVYSGNRQIHTKCQLQYLHPPHISTSGKCRCVIIHQTTKATEYIGYMSKYHHKSPLSHICTNHSICYKGTLRAPRTLTWQSLDLVQCHLIARTETSCRNFRSYSLRLADLSYAPTHRHASIYQGLCYTSRGSASVYGAMDHWINPSRWTR